MATASDSPELLYIPGHKVTDGMRVTEFVDWLAVRGTHLADWEALQQWSVADLGGFWRSVWDFFEVQTSKPYDSVLADRRMPGAVWFPGARLNYAEHCLRGAADSHRNAILAHSQSRPVRELSYAELREQVRRARSGLRRLGVSRGDRVVAYLPNIPEAMVAFLAVASLGAIWAACAPEFGPVSVLDRFAQIEPTVLITVSGYTYGHKQIDRGAAVAALRAGLPTVETVVHVPYGLGDVPEALSWDDLLSGESDDELAFEQLPFDAPLFVLFSSGTTGKPKAIVHCHGGILVEQYKATGLQWDLRPGDRLQFFTTTAWMLWNAQVSAFLVGASVVLLDGDPTAAGLDTLWRLAAQTRATHMGASPAWVMASRQAGLHPTRDFDLSALRMIACSGSPLPPEGYSWVYEEFGSDIFFNVGSGGTDVCSGLIGGAPWRPVWLGEMGGPALGVALAAFDPDGRSVTGQLGELVITEPMPSMPIALWGDDDGSRYRQAYFERYPGVWRHGDWVRFSSAGTAVITGRSDATLNRGGVRLGTAEFYRVVDQLPEVLDSIVVHLEDQAGGLGELVLFLRLVDGRHLDGELRATISSVLRTALSPRHVPDRMVSVPAIPYTRTGKKLEVPVKRILLGASVDDVAVPDGLVDATALAAYREYAQAHPRV